jgi:hypothetical protein
VSYLPGLRDEVMRAATRRAEVSSSSRGLRFAFARRPVRRIWSGLALAASIAIVVAVVLIAVGVRGSAPTAPPAGSGPHLPPLTAAQHRRVSRIVKGIMQPVPQSCQHHPRRHPSISNGSPDRTILSTLGVLRRKATPADNLDNLDNFPVLNTARGIYVRYVRLARTYRGTRYYLVPAADTGAPSARCGAEELQRLETMLPRIPRQLRAAVQQAVSRNAQATMPHEGVMFFSLGPDSGGDSGTTIQNIRRCGGDVGGYGGPSHRPLSEIIPDGVTSVTATFAPQPQSAHLSVTARPVNNVLVLRVPNGSINGLVSMVWRSSSGRVIRTVSNFGACY